MPIPIKLKGSRLSEIQRTLIDTLNDVRIFGPSVLSRNFAHRDVFGVVSLKTWVGEFNLRPFDSDMNVLRQVFVKRDYDLSKFAQMDRLQQTYEAIISAGSIPIIIDAGANIGAASLWFSSLFPRAKIIAVEPDTRNAAICVSNCRKRANIEVVRAALGSSPGKVKLTRPFGDQVSWAIQTERCDDESVSVVTIDSVRDMYGNNGDLFLVKVDIEGFEKDLFASNTEWLSDVSVLIIELHDWMLPGQKSSLPFQKAIFSRDFEMLISSENLIFVK
jgi:FkbM family methyltransferase